MLQKMRIVNKAMATYVKKIELVLATYVSANHRYIDTLCFLRLLLLFYVVMLRLCSG